MGREVDDPSGVGSLLRRQPSTLRSGNDVVTSDTSNHIHHYELKGSGLSCWAQCECGEKLAGERGPIVGSRGKVEAACNIS
jgi:hypothetical protein